MTWCEKHHRALFVIIHNKALPVTTNILCQVFSPYGDIEKIVRFQIESSIDGLLDQTIKHMLFLINVTEQAEKVKQVSDQKLPVNENRETSSAHTFGTSSTKELGDGSCPIIVKDLEHPGDILIQMLCNNEEVFFEVAEAMHQLKLTILRGVMETQSKKWAHFIVQASNGFNRLDIFWPLMRILQRNGNWSLNQWCPSIYIEENNEIQSMP